MVKHTTRTPAPATVWEDALATAAGTVSTQWWVGLSGEQVTGQAVARHLQAATVLLEKDGWIRHYLDDPTIDLPDDASMSVKDMVRQLMRAVRELVGPGDPRRTLSGAVHEIGRSTEGDTDTAVVAGCVLDAIVKARTGTANAYFGAWSERTGRTWSEVAELLATATAFARFHGPETREARAA